MSFDKFINENTIINEDYTGIIYKAINKVTGKYYIGQTIFLIENRIKHHYKMSKKHRCYFQNSLHYHGLDNFEWDIIDTFNSKEEADYLETLYIEKYKSKFPEGYNLTEGGGGASGYKHTIESRNKISNANKGKKCPFLIERNKTKKMRDIAVKTHTGKKVSDETKKKMSEKKKLLVGEKHPQFGTKHTKERRMKNSQSQIGLQVGEKNGRFGKRKFKVDINDVLLMRKNGLTYQQLMDRFNISYYVVKKIIRGLY